MTNGRLMFIGLSLSIGLLFGHSSEVRAHETCVAAGCCAPHGNTKSLNAAYSFNSCVYGEILTHESTCTNNKTGGTDWIDLTNYTYGRRYCSSATGSGFGCGSGLYQTGYSSGKADERYNNCKNTWVDHHNRVLYGVDTCKSSCL